jgi:SAM-dependent methyltransferase
LNPKAYLEMAEIESSHWWFRGRRAITASILEPFFTNERLKILEVGCGTGGNLEMLGALGEVSAFEIDPTALQIANLKTNWKFKIKHGACPHQIPFESMKFDLICMFDVLEHISDDLDSLISLRKLLMPNGKIVITVPAYQWLYGPHDIFLHHKRRYTSTELIKLASAANLRVIKTSYFNSILFPPIALIRILQKSLKANTYSSTKLPLPFLNSMLRFIFSIERYLLRYVDIPFGLSIIGIFDILDIKNGHKNKNEIMGS